MEESSLAQLDIDGSGRLLLDVIGWMGEPIIEAYNDKIVGMEDFIRSLDYPFLNGIVRFENIEFIMPTTIVLPQDPYYPIETSKQFDPNFMRTKISQASSSKTKAGLKPLYPYDARLRGLNYSSSVFVDIIYQNFDRDIPEERQRIYLGKFPVMTGSILCHLNGLSKQQLMDLNEDPNSFFGYFIYKGINKVIYNQQRTQTDRIFTVPLKNSIYCTLTTEYSKGLQQIYVTKDENDVINLRVPIFVNSDNHRGEVNFILAYALFDIAPTDVINYLKPYIPEKYITHFINAITPSVINFSNNIYQKLDVEIKVDIGINDRRPSNLRRVFLDQLFYRYTLDIKKYEKELKDIAWTIYLRQRAKLNKLSNEEVIQSDGEESGGEGNGGSEDGGNGNAMNGGNAMNEGELNEALHKYLAEGRKIYDLYEFLPEEGELDIYEYLKKSASKDEEQLIDDLIEKIAEIDNNRIEMLSIMVTKFIGTTLGIYPLDDRDSWENKFISPAGYWVNSLFQQIINSRFIKINRIKKIRGFDSLVKSLNKGIISKDMDSSMTTGKWGIRNRISSRKLLEGIAGNLLPISENHQIAETRTISTPTSRVGTNITRREAHPSQLDRVCIVETPEGSTCGLLQSLAIAAHISRQRNESDIINYILNLIKNLGIDNKSTGLPIIVNGRMIAKSDIFRVHKLLLDARRRMILPFDLSPVLIGNFLYVHSMPERLCAPYLIIDEKTGNPVIDEMNGWNLSVGDLVSRGAIEFIDSWEIAQRGEQMILIAESREIIAKRRSDMELMENQIKNNEEELAQLIQEQRQLQGARRSPNRKRLDDIKLEIVNKNKLINKIKEDLDKLRRNKYTHMIIDPNTMLGFLSSRNPLAQTNAPARNTFAVKMAKQGPSSGARSKINFASVSYTAVYSQSAILQTQTDTLFPTGRAPVGNSLMVAVLAWYGKGEEDSMILNRTTSEQGAGMIVKRFSFMETTEIEGTEKKKNKSNVNVRQQIGLHPELKISPEEKKLYHAIDPTTGVAVIGSYIKPGECIITKTEIVEKEGRTTYRNVSLFMKIGSEGKVSNVLIIGERRTDQTVYVQFDDYRRLIEGSKVAIGKSGQKGTIGAVIDPSKMPFDVRTGEVPAIIINPHSIPKRMTIEVLYEIIMSSAGALSGRIINGTSFRPIEINSFYRILELYGYNYNGKRQMISGIDGTLINSDIYMGMCQVVALKHTPHDKITSRGDKGAIDPVTRQPVKGRQKGGAIRFGEMEVAVTHAWGATGVILDRLLYSSDDHVAVFCTICNTIALPRPETNSFVCKVCPEHNNFGVCHIPYALRYLQNLMSGMWVRIDVKVKKINGQYDLGVLDLIVEEDKLRTTERRKTGPYISQFERIKMLAKRADQIDEGSPPLVDYKGEINSLNIARMELKAKVIPFGIRRTLPDGSYEDWRLDEFLNI